MAKQPTVAVDNTKETTPVNAGAVIPHINPKALQKDLGPQIIKMFAGIDEAKEKLEALRVEIGNKNYAAIAKLTKGVYDVSKADPNVALADHFGGDDKKKQFLNESLYLALGMKEVIKVGTGANQTDRVVWSKAVKDFLPQYGEATDTPEYERKNTFRTNLSKQLNKAIGAALDIHKRKLDARFDEGAQTLVISGPEVKKQFGVPEVALNERVTVTNADGMQMKLLEKPSFQSLYNKAAASEGLPTASKSNDRTRRPITDPSAAIVELATVFLNAVGRAKPDELTKPAIEALTKIRDAIDALGVVD